MCLQVELTWSGCPLDADAFRLLLVRQFRSRFSTWTPTDLCRHAAAAETFCSRVRAAAGSECLPDAVILGTLKSLQ